MSATDTSASARDAAHFDVFLSYSSRDREIVERIAQRLQRAGVAPWLDRWQLTPGGEWQRELGAGLDASVSCAVFVGQHDLGAWELQEVAVAIDRAATQRGFRVFAVLLPGVEEPFDPNRLPHFLRMRTWVDFRGGRDDTRALQDLVNAVRGVPFGPPLPVGPNDDIAPYRGLRVFGEEDARFFFGRDREVQRLIEKLKRSRFVAVLGPSGSGKSSLVRAGLVPLLRSGALAQVEGWHVVVLRPGASPLTALAAQLATLGAGQAMQATLDALGDDPRTLHLFVELALADRSPGERVLVIVDQLEEIFTLCRDERERQQLFSTLLLATSAVGGRTVVIVTMRADFYARCAAYPELAQLVASEQMLVGPMDADGLRQAIEEPAHRVGLELEQGLTDTILADVADEPGSLPLLEHALLELWERRRGDLLTLEGYRETGGVEGALAQRADEIFAQFSAKQQQIARRALLRLTQPGEGTEDTRRRATRSELAPADGDDDDVELVLGRLVDARMLTTGRDETGLEVVDVSHEALIRSWPRMRDWIDADRAGLLVHRRLTDAAREWDALDREAGALYQGARLAAAREWAAEHEDDLSELDRAFLAASAAAERRRALRRRLVLAAGVIALGVSIVAANVFYGQRQTARSQSFAAQALDATRDDPEEGLRLALRAADLGDGTLAQRALREAVAAAGWTRILREDSRSPVTDVDVSPDGGLAASAGEDGVVGLWDTRTGKRVAALRHRGAVHSVRFDVGGSRIVTAGSDATARVWDRAGRLVRELPTRAGEVRSAVFDRAGRRVLTATAGGAAQLWDLRSAAGPIRLAGAGGNPLDVSSFSPDGTRAVTAGAPGELRVWTLAGRPTAVALRPEAARQRSHMTVAAFSPDSSRVLGGNDAGEACLWELASGSRSCYRRDGAISEASFSADGKLLVTASAAGTAEVRRTADLRRVATLRHAGPVNAASFNAAGTRVVTAGEDRVARIWTTGGHRERELAGHTDAVRFARFSRDGAAVLTGSRDGSARIWATNGDVRTLPGSPLAGADVAFSPDSGRLLAVDTSGRAAVWDLRHAARTDLAGAMAPNDLGLAPCDRVTGCAPWGAASRSVAGASGRYEATIWDATSGAPRSLGVQRATGAAFDPAGRRLAVVGRDAPALVLDRDGTHRLEAAPRGSRAFVPSAEFGAGGRLLLTVDVDGRVAVSDAATGRTVSRSARATQASAAALAPDGSLLAVGTLGGVLRVQEVDGTAVGATAPQGVSVVSVAFDRTGGRIVTTHEDRAARVWDARALGAPLAVLRGQDGALLGAEFSLDGRFVLVSGADGMARLWDPKLGTSVLALPTGEGGVARFSPDGRLIAAGGRRTVEVHRCVLCEPFDELVRVARGRLPAG